MDAARLTIAVPAPSAKARKDQWVPLRPDLAEALRCYLAANPGAPTDPLFPRKLFPSERTYYKDLDAAGIAHKDEQGRVADFHSLRETFVSSLAAAGVHPRLAQALARHSTVELTMVRHHDRRYCTYGARGRTRT